MGLKYIALTDPMYRYICAARSDAADPILEALRDLLLEKKVIDARTLSEMIQEKLPEPGGRSGPRNKE